MASRANILRLKFILHRYANVSGQKFNPAKTKAYFGRHVPAHNWRYARTTLGIGIGDLPFTYLGVPLFRGAPKAMHLRGIADHIIAKFATWKGSTLSMAGRICLVNSVIASSLVHSMMIYKWSRSLLNKIDRAMRCFIWMRKIERQGFSTVSWGKACSSKDEGGLGIRFITLSNDAFLQKLAWSVLTRGRRLRPHVISILGEARWILGQTSAARFWLNNWMCYIIGIPHFARRFLAFPVSDYFFDDFWHFDEFFVMKHMDIVEDMIHYSCEVDSDTLIWPRSVHVVTLTSKVAYAGLQQRFPSVSWGNWIWGPFIPAKRSTVLWRLIHGKLPSWYFLHYKGFSGPSQCVFCDSAVEDMDHLFSLYPCTHHIISNVSFIFNVNLHFDFGFGHWLLQAVLRTFSPQTTTLWRLCIVTIIWMIWDQRNKRIFRGLSLVIRACSPASGLISVRLGMASKLFCAPLFQVMKINVDGGAFGSPSHLTGGGVFRDNFRVFRGCFAVSQGWGFAFEAELASALYAVELAHDRVWTNIWLESDSTYVVHILKSSNLDVHWRLLLGGIVCAGSRLI
ncbi:hypothetical protein ACS0TY_026131 [Phlomoides rotata]